IPRGCRCRGTPPCCRCGPTTSNSDASGADPGRDRQLVQAETNRVDHSLVDRSESVAFVVTADPLILREAIEADVITTSASCLFHAPCNRVTAASRGGTTHRETVEVECLIPCSGPEERVGFEQRECRHRVVVDPHDEIGRASC